MGRSREHHLVRMAYVLAGDFHRAEDLVQEALIRAAQRWPTLHEGNPEAWVRTLICRTNVSWWRRHRREVLVERIPEAGGPAMEPSDVVPRVLALLTRQQRAVMLLRFVEDLSVVDTAGSSVSVLARSRSKRHSRSSGSGSRNRRCPGSRRRGDETPGPH